MYACVRAHTLTHSLNTSHVVSTQFPCTPDASAVVCTVSKHDSRSYKILWLHAQTPAGGDFIRFWFSSGPTCARACARGVQWAVMCVSQIEHSRTHAHAETRVPLCGIGCLHAIRIIIKCTYSHRDSVRRCGAIFMDWRLGTLCT